SARVARGGPLLSEGWGLLAELSVWALAWVVAVAAAFRLPPRAAVFLVIVMAVGLRLAAITGPPTTTDDFYRYSWDGRVQAAGVNPYEYTPGSAQLTHLREPWLWPEEHPCPLAFRPNACTRINRPSVHTIYPPVAEAWFAGIYRLTGIEARWKPWQVAGLLTDVAVVALLAVALRRSGKDPRWCALYALCPAPVLEIVNNGHVDGLAIGLALAAFVVAGSPRQPAARRELLAGALLGAAALVKLFPALFILALVAAATGRRRALVRIGGAAGAVAVAGYLPHVLQVGTKVVGFLPGYLREEQYDGAGRYLVAGGLGVPGALAALLSGGALLAAAVWVWKRRSAAPTGAAVILGVLLLAASPVQPWYAVTLLAFATLAVEPKWAAVVVAGYPYFFAVILLHPQRTGIGQLAYGLAAAAVAGAGAALLRGWRARARSMEGCPRSGC
ncbi:MAG: glycosyltransferase 87 family protein, partial [Acidimicrobiia bacterium]